MIKLSRRQFMCGVAAIAAVAPVALPSILGERDMIAGFDLGSGDRTVLWVSHNAKLYAYDGEALRCVFDTPKRNWFDLRVA